MASESLNLPKLSNYLDTSMNVRHGMVGEIAALSTLESTVLGGCAGRGVITPAVTLASLVEAEWHRNETNARAIYNIVSVDGSGTISFDSAEIEASGVPFPVEGADYGGISDTERAAIERGLARDLEDGGVTNVDAEALAELIADGLDPELAAVLHHYGPAVAADYLQEQIDALGPIDWTDLDVEVILQKGDLRDLLNKVVTDHWGLTAEQAEGALTLIGEGAYPEIAVTYMQIQTGDLQVDIDGPIPEWQIMALFNSDPTLLEVSGAGQENFNGDFLISENDANYVIDNAGDFSPNAVALATYMLNHPDDTLGVHYGPEPGGGGVDGWGDIIPSVWDAFDPTSGDSLWGEMGNMGREIGHEFTKVPGNLADASVELVMQPVYLYDAVQGCAHDPNLGDCSHVAVTVVAAVVARRVPRPRTTAAATPGRGAVTNSNFAQNNVVRGTKKFSDEGQEIFSDLAGYPIQTVDDLTAALRSGDITPAQIPVDYVVVNGNQLVTNTRTSTALRNADIPQSEWFGRNQTGVPVPGMPGTVFDDLAEQQLARNDLPPEGSPTLGVDGDG